MYMKKPIKISENKNTVCTFQLEQTEDLISTIEDLTDDNTSSVDINNYPVQTISFRVSTCNPLLKI